MCLTESDFEHKYNTVSPVEMSNLENKFLSPLIWKFIWNVKYNRVFQEARCRW